MEKLRLYILQSWVGVGLLSSSSAGVGAGAWGHLGQWEGWQTGWEGCRHSIYWTQAHTWPTIQRGQVSNRGLNGEETHRVLEVWQRLQALQRPQQGRATKLLNMSRQQLSVVIVIGHLGLNGHLYKIGKDINQVWNVAQPASWGQLGSYLIEK